MTLHTLLALYYLCDQTAAQRLLSRQEAAQCIAHYERVKLEFLEAAPARPGTPERRNARRRTARATRGSRRGKATTQRPSVA